jgi:hypothetical protein
VKTLRAVDPTAAVIGYFLLLKMNNLLNAGSTRDKSKTSNIKMQRRERGQVHCAFFAHNAPSECEVMSVRPPGCFSSETIEQILIICGIGGVCTKSCKVVERIETWFVSLQCSSYRGTPGHWCMIYVDLLLFQIV